MFVRYTGRANARILDSADLKQAGVEDFRKTTFPRGEVVEVSDTTGEVLLENALFGGEFERVEPEGPRGTQEGEAVPPEPDSDTERETSRSTTEKKARGKG